MTPSSINSATSATSSTGLAVNSMGRYDSNSIPVPQAGALSSTGDGKLEDGTMSLKMTSFNTSVPAILGSSSHAIFHRG